MKDLEQLLEQEDAPEMQGIPGEEEEDEVDSLREVRDFVEQNSSVDFRGSNNLVQSNIIVREAIPANSKFNVGSFAKLAELISTKTGIKVTQRQAAASWYYILYQLFHNK